MYSSPGRQKPLAFAVCLVLLLAVIAPAPPSEAARTTPDAASQAAAALAAGRAQLSRNRADEALPQLQNALALFTQANDTLGAAAARDAVGDIYQRQGQHAVALDNYRAAFDAFCARRDGPSADLLTVKIGETQYLAGDAEAARGAFARIGQCGSPDQDGRGTDGNPRGGGAFAFLPAAAAASLGACSALSGPNNGANNVAQNPVTGPLQNAAPTLGHGPTPRSRTVRMDLKVVDQQGRPVQNARAKLASERQGNGLLCECEHITNPRGEVLMDPIHLTKTLKLEVEAKGYEPLTTSVDPASLNRPFQAVLQAKGAAAAAGAAASAANAAASAAQSAGGAAACAGLYRLFVARGFGAIGSARADYESGRLDAARARYEGLLAASAEGSPAGSLQAARLFRAVARTGLGDIAFKEGRFPDAARLYREAADGARKDNRLELAWAAQRGLGRSLWAQAAQSPADAGKRNESLDAYRAAISTVEKLYSGSIRADEARTNFLASTRDLFDEAAAAFAESALSDSAPAAPRSYRITAHAEPATEQLTARGLPLAAEAFRVVEQGRARSLLDLISESRAEITEGLPAELVARKLANRARQNEVVERLRGVRAANAQQPPQQQSVAQLEAELERLSVEHDQIENDLRTASARYRAHLAPLSLADAQQQVLDDGTALLAYSLGRERSYLFVVTRAGVALFRLPARSEIEQQVTELRTRLLPPGSRRAIAGEAGLVGAEDADAAQSMRGLVLGGGAPNETKGVAEYAAAAQALYRTVVAPAAAVFGTRRLLVAPDGALNYVPFEALVTAPGGADYASLNYLVKTNEIVYAPSASVLAAVRQRPRAAAGGVLVVADPVFDASDARALGLTAATKAAPVQRAALQSAMKDVTGSKLMNLRLARLTGTRTEAERIADFARGGGGAADVWLDFDASEANIRRRRLDGYRVLHFATHGLLDAERPQFTGLALTLVGDPEADGFLRVEEVFNLRLGSPLVVLSACETGLGREKRGEGVIGLTRAFMYAGAPTVGVSLWAVADRSTAELMPEFYKRLLASGGREPAAAMRAAQQQMIAGKRYSAPFYWAPFVLVGDWR